jgi:hypothetical protein
VAIVSPYSAAVQLSFFARSSETYCGIICVALDEALRLELAFDLPEHTSNCVEKNVSDSIQLMLVRMLTLNIYQWKPRLELKQTYQFQESAIATVVSLSFSCDTGRHAYT